MKKILIIVILVSVSFINIVKAEQYPQYWLVTEEILERSIGFHKDNYYAMLLEYGEDKIGSTDLLRRVDLIAYLSNRRVGEMSSAVTEHTMKMHERRLSMLKFWDGKRDEIKKNVENIEANKSLGDDVKKQARKTAINYFINSYGSIKLIEKMDREREEFNKKNQGGQ